MGTADDTDNGMVAIRCLESSPGPGRSDLVQVPLEGRIAAVLPPPLTPLSTGFLLQPSGSDAADTCVICELVELDGLAAGERIFFAGTDLEAARDLLAEQGQANLAQIRSIANMWFGVEVMQLIGNCGDFARPDQDAELAAPPLDPGNCVQATPQQPGWQARFSSVQSLFRCAYVEGSNVRNPLRSEAQGVTEYAIDIGAGEMVVVGVGDDLADCMNAFSAVLDTGGQVAFKGLYVGPTPAGPQGFLCVEAEQAS